VLARDSTVKTTVHRFFVVDLIFYLDKKTWERGRWRRELNSKKPSSPVGGEGFYVNAN
jgi:hypothetical protein